MRVLCALVKLLSAALGLRHPSEWGAIVMQTTNPGEAMMKTNYPTLPTLLFAILYVLHEVASEMFHNFCVPTLLRPVCQSCGSEF